LGRPGLAKGLSISATNAAQLKSMGEPSGIQGRIQFFAFQSCAAGSSPGKKSTVIYGTGQEFN
jgi:hypothetical protein